MLENNSYQYFIIQSLFLQNLEFQNGVSTCTRVCSAVGREIYNNHILCSVLKIEVVAASPGKCSCEVTLDEFHLNRSGALHGGFTATLVDGVSTIAIMCAEKPPGVSVDMNITYVCIYVNRIYMYHSVIRVHAYMYYTT